MSRLKKLFETKKNICSIFYTAGFPNLGDTANIALELERSGVDLIEIGIPFSDPLADGEVIQQSSKKALDNGMNLELLVEQISDIRRHSDIPIILMGYLNPIYKYGLDRFVRRCAEIGVDGLIIPDLYPEIYKRDYQELFESEGVPLIFLVTTNTEAERLKFIDNLSRSFIYLLSDSSTTGRSKNYSDAQIYQFQLFAKKDVRSPVLLGFGIHNAENFKTACSNFDGGIVGSAFLRYLEGENTIHDFVHNLKKTS